MALQAVMPAVGKINSIIHGVPVVGEMMVRATSRAVGTLAFKAPILGGTPSQHIGHVRSQWLRFLGLVGIHPVEVVARDGEFEMVMDECPWGFTDAEEQDLCDACMDLDRIYVHHLKGRLEIVERITAGDGCCRLKISFQ